MSFGKTLNSKFLPMVLEVPCMAAATYECVSEWVLEIVHPFTHTKSTISLTGCESCIVKVLWSAMSAVQSTFSRSQNAKWVVGTDTEPHHRYISRERLFPCWIYTGILVLTRTRVRTNPEPSLIEWDLLEPSACFPDCVTAVLLTSPRYCGPTLPICSYI